MDVGEDVSIEHAARAMIVHRQNQLRTLFGRLPARILSFRTAKALARAQAGDSNVQFILDETERKKFKKKRPPADV
jgi:hypothetical protein